MLRTLARRQLLLRGSTVPARAGVAHAAPQPQAAAPSSSRLPPHVAALHTAMRPSAPLAKNKKSRPVPPSEVHEVDEELDDLFGESIRAAPPTAAELPPAAEQHASGGFSITEELSHSELFRKHLQDFRNATAQWSEHGAPLPSFAPFGSAQHAARSREEFEQLFELWAELRRQGMPRLPQRQYLALAQQALTRGHSELVLHLILNGDEPELYKGHWLRAIQHRLLRRLLANDPITLAASAESPGAPQRSPEWLEQLQQFKDLRFGRGGADEAVNEDAEQSEAAPEQSKAGLTKKQAARDARRSAKREANFVERATNQVVLIDRMLQCAALKPVDGRHDWYLLAAALAACHSRVRQVAFLPLADETAELLRLLRVALADPAKIAGRKHEKKYMRRTNPETRIQAVVKEHLPQEDVQDVVAALHALLDANAETPEKPWGFA